MAIPELRGPAARHEHQEGRRIRPILPLLIAALFAGIIGGAIGGGALYWGLQRLEAPLSPSPTAATLPASNAEHSDDVRYDVNEMVTQAVAGVSPAVVTVISHLPPRVTFFGNTIEQSGAGSGVIVSPQGAIVTNFHVIEGAERLEVVLVDGQTLPAELKGIDPYGDLAVLSLSGEVPAVASWGNSNTLRPGESVIAIGSPLGAFKNSVTVGVVSATGCSIDTGRDYQLEGLIQTDAAINQGNSGGPLVNLRGEVVGINTLIVRGGGSGGAIAEGLGFAIPSNTARAVVDQIIAKGYVARPFMGIDWGWITPDISARYDLPVKYGVFVTHVVPDGPADQAGILRGDILSAIDGKPFGPNNPFINALFEYTPGSVVTLDVIRGVDRLRIELTLDEHRAP